VCFLLFKVPCSVYDDPVVASSASSSVQHTKAKTALLKMDKRERERKMRKEGKHTIHSRLRSFRFSAEPKFQQESQVQGMTMFLGLV